MSNPFSHDDSSEEAANDRLQEKLADGIRATEGSITKVRDNDDALGDVEISLAPDKEDDDEEEERETRQDKKRNRYREEQERASAAEAQNRRLEAKIAALEVQQQSSRGAPAVDPYREELDSNYRARQDIAEKFNAKSSDGSLTDTDRKDMMQRSRELEERGQEIVAERTHARAAAGRSPTEGNMERVMNRHPDVAENREALQYANGLAQMRQAQGERYSTTFVDSVMNETREKFNMGAYGHPSDVQRARYGAPPSGGGGRGSGPKSIKMTSDMQKLAYQAYPGISDAKERNKKWAQGPDRRFMELEKQSGRGR